MLPEKETRIIEKKTCKTIMILRVFSDIDAVVPNLLEYNRGIHLSRPSFPLKSGAAAPKIRPGTIASCAFAHSSVIMKYYSEVIDEKSIRKRCIYEPIYAQEEYEPAARVRYGVPPARRMFDEGDTGDS